MTARLIAPPAAVCLLLAARCFPASASPPFVLDDGDTVTRGHSEIDLGSLATEAQTGARGDLLYVEADVGVVPGIETDIVAPLAFARHSHSLQTGSGDIEFQEKFRIIDQDLERPWPSVSAEPALIVPTGNASHGLGTGHLQAPLALWFSKDVGLWNVFGGGGYTLNPGANQRNFILAGLGLVRDLGERWHLGGEAYETTRTARDSPGGLTVDLDAVGDISGAVHVFVSIGRGFGPGAVARQATLFAGLQLTE